LSLGMAAIINDVSSVIQPACAEHSLPGIALRIIQIAPVHIAVARPSGAGDSRAGESCRLIASCRAARTARIAFHS
jgi:hypothetical protein